MLSRFLNVPSKGSTTTSQTSGWRPLYLRKRILILFLLTFAAIIAALEVLYQSSEARNGIATSTQDRHYLWTYGPTAILTIVAAFWSRVEFQTKQSAPWQAMLEGPQPAEKSVLLDYISDLQPVAIWNALKNKHFAVASGVSCSLLLRLLIIFSTSLFSLKEVPVKRNNVPIQLFNIFSAQDSKIETVGSQPYDILNGILFENVTYPIGTSENLTFQEFSAPSLPENAVITTPINGMMADLDCEPASLEIRTLDYLADEDGRYSTNFDVGISTPACKIANISLLSGEKTQTAYFKGGRCNGISGSDGYRIVLTMAAPYEINSTSAEPPNNSSTDAKKTWKTVHLGLKKSISMICKPKLSFLKLQAEGNATESSSAVDIKIMESEVANLPGITAGDIAEFVIKNSTATTGFRPVEDSLEFEYYSAIDRGFNLGLHLIDANLTVDSLWQDGILESSGKAFYRSITALLIHMGLTHTKQSTAVGVAIVQENRVVMVQLPLRGMEACLGFAAWNTNHLSAMAAITANSTAFRSALSGTGVTSHKKLQTRLVDKDYFLEPTDKGTSVGILEIGHRESQPDSPFGTEYVPWKPFPGIIGRIIIFVLILSAIAVLEILLHVSQNQDGLGDAHSNDEYMHYLWTIIPALIMVGIGLFFGSLDFNIRCLAPYAPLSRPEGTAFERSMGLSFLDSLGLTNGLRSISSRHFAVQATTLATAASLFLTIITSGLYSVNEVPTQSQANFTRVGGFPDPRTIAGPQRLMNEAKEVDGMFTAEYILQYNFSYPRWTYEELAFAEISMDGLPGTENLNGSFVDIIVPAVRLAPVCHQYTAEELQPSFRFYDGDGTTGSYYLTINQTTLACPGNNTNSYGNISVLSIQDINPQPFGKSFESQCHFETENNNGVIGASHYTTSYVWGYFNSTSIQHITGLYCIQYAELVDVRTRFLLPGMEIDENNPPVPDESSARKAEDLYTPIPEWWILNSNGQYPEFDGFFQDLTSGRYAISVDNFQREEHNQNVAEAIQRQYKIITAQQFNNYTRGTANNSIQHEPLLGNITSSNRLRVVQDVTSTRILEALLAFMLALGILGSVLLNTDRILPKNPCSIAAITSLLADSQIPDEFLRGAWDPDSKQLAQTFAGHRFHLGWWEKENEEGSEADGKFFAIDHAPTGKVV
ncbi:unnamed protein product [Penicillium manginii]